MPISTTSSASPSPRSPLSPTRPLPNPDENAPSQSTLALLSLSQDITALISLSLEAGASLVHDWFKSSLGIVGLSEVVRYSPTVGSPTGQRGVKAGMGGESGRGMGIVVVGASEATGQSLTLHLAKSGYTVFPLLPLPSPHSPPTSLALSTLLLTWSSIQKRLRSRSPNHSGSVVPVITDPEFTSDWGMKGRTFGASPISAGAGGGRFGHAGETVRAYCKDNGLTLVAVICASRSPRSETKEPWTRLTSPPLTTGAGTKYDEGKLEKGEISPTSTPPSPIPASPPRQSLALITTTNVIPSPRILSPAALTMTDEMTLLSLYRTNVLDPLSVIRELSDLLAVSASQGKGRGRVVFVNGGREIGLGGDDEVDLGEDGREAFTGRKAAMRMVGAARGEAAKVLRGELGGVGIDVCEVVVGPMSPRIKSKLGYHLRHTSEDSTDSDINRRQILSNVLSAQSSSPHVAQSVASRLTILSRVFAVDDALLFSAVRRAIEDRYPRYRHHAGLSPLIESVLDGTPGGGVVKDLGGWVLGLVFGTTRRN